MREDISKEKKTVKNEIMTRQKEKIREHEEQWKTYNVLVFSICNLIGTIIAVYVGGWIMIVKSVLGTYAAYTGGTLTFAYLIKAVIKCALSATAAGAIWCGGYILGRKLER